MRQSSLLIIFLIVFLDLVGFGIVIPILPYYASSYGASAWKLGWLMASYSLLQFFVSPVWGRISDYVGRRPVLLLSLLGTSLSMLLLGLAGSLAWLFIGRIMAGICGANISTAYAYVADVTTDRDRAKGMGMIGAGFGLGFIFGPAIGGVLSRYGYGVPMFAAAALGFANLIFAFFRLEEPRLTRDAREANRSKRFDLENYRVAFADSRTRAAIFTFFLVTLAVTQMETVFAIYMLARYGLDAQHAGFLLALSGVIMVGVQGGLIGRLNQRFGETKLILGGTVVCAVALSAFVLVGTVPLVTLALCALALGHGVLHPTLSSLASLGAPPNRRGAVMGVFHSMGSLSRVFGPIFAGWLYDHVSWRAPYFSGSVALMVAFLGVAAWAIARPSPVGLQSR